MKNIEFRKRVDPETRRKIGKGVKTHYDKKGRKRSANEVKRKIGLALGAAGVLGGAGLLAIKKRGSKLGTPQNPYVERAMTPTLDSKTTTSSIKESFYDLMGKFRRKGQFMPKGQGEPMVGSRKQVIKVKLGYSRDKYKPKDWTTVDVESSRFSRLIPYTVNFQELDYSVPTKIQSLVKDSIERINFAKEEKVDSYTTKRGKRVRSFRRKRTKEEKQRSRLENVGAGLVGSYVALNVVGATAPTQLDIDIANRKLANVFGDKNDPVFGKMRREAYDNELNLNKKFKNIVERETINKEFLENRAKYESALNTTDATSEMRQKAAERFKKKYGADIANPDKVKAAEAFNKNAARMKQQAVVNNSLGNKAPSKVLRNAALIGLGAAGATKAYAIATRNKKKKKK